MANTSAPFGFRQVSGTGSSPTYEQVTRFTAYNTANIFLNDPVFTGSDGSIQGITTGPGPGTAAIAGIFAGCRYPSIANKRTVWSNYWPGSDVASTNTVESYIINDPTAQFVVQSGNSNTTAVTGFTTANIQLNAQFSYGTGNTSNGISGAFLDIYVTPATTTTLPFRVLGLVTSPPGAPGTASGAFNLVQVGFNNVETRSLQSTNA